MRRRPFSRTRDYNGQRDFDLGKRSAGVLGFDDDRELDVIDVHDAEEVVALLLCNYASWRLLC